MAAAARELMIHDHGEVRWDSRYVPLALPGRREVISGADSGKWALDTIRALHPETSLTGRPAPMRAEANGIHVKVGHLGTRIRPGES